MIGFIGGTGPEGRGLALRFALSGEKVFIGSRDTTRGIEVAKKMNDLCPDLIDGGSNETASKVSDIIIIVLTTRARWRTCLSNA